MAIWKTGRSIAASLFLAVCLTACATDMHHFHYRLTVTVDDNGKICSGSSVVAIGQGLHRGYGILIDSTALDVKGEATVIELDDGRYLLALLTGSMSGARGYFRPWGATPSPVLAAAYGVPQNRDMAAVLADLSRLRGPREIPPSWLPDMVTFTDSSDPATLVVVDPLDMTTSLPGVHFVSATIALTDDPVTTPRLGAVLPWIKVKVTDRESPTIKALDHFGFLLSSFTYGLG